MEVNDKFVAGGGTTALGIIGTALGGLATVANGGLPLFGGQGRVLDAAEAKIAKLEAEKYTDEALIREREHSAAADVLVATLTEQVKQMSIKNAADIEAMKEENRLRAEIDRQQAKINLLEAVAPINARIDANTSAIAALSSVVGGITKVVVPSTAVCAQGSARA